LFISLLGRAFIFFAWLAFFGPPLSGVLAIPVVYGFAVFKWVGDLSGVVKPIRVPAANCLEVHNPLK